MTLRFTFTRSPQRRREVRLSPPKPPTPIHTNITKWGVRAPRRPWLTKYENVAVISSAQNFGSFIESQHPRLPRGTPGGIGGQFRRK